MSLLRLNACFLTLLTALMLYIDSASAQASVSIGEGFDCLTDLDGSKTLGKLESTGFRKVKFATVEAKIERELGALEQKGEKLQEISKEKPSTFDRLLIGFIKSFISRFPNLDVDTDFDDRVQRNEVVKGLKGYIKRHRVALRAVVKRARACKGGTTSPPQNGSTISPTVKLVSFHGVQGAYAGFLLLTKPRVPKFSTKPGGFNVCTRISFPAEGSAVAGSYTGVSTDLCFSGGGVVEDSAVAACNATLPAGFVGLFLLKAQGTDISPTGLQDLESLIVGNPPSALLLALDQSTASRDAELAKCAKFLQ